MGDGEVHRLSRTDARRIAVRAQLLDRDRPADLVETVRHLATVQNDFTAAVAPNADLVAWSRLGAAYGCGDIGELLADGTLVELRGLIMPAEDIALHRDEMRLWPDTPGAPEWRYTQGEWVDANDTFRNDLLDRLEREGPLTSRELPDTCEVPWRSSGWNNNRNVVIMLDLMVMRGEVASTGQLRGRERLWDLAERVYPDVPTVAAEQAITERNRRRLTALGIARSRTTQTPIDANDVDVAGRSAAVDGVRGRWRVDAEQLDRLGEPFRGRAALISPLDRLVFDRKRMEEMFEFDYQLEMYKPAARRRWGYFALPILYGDRLVGKLDATADRKAGVLRVNAVHRDGDWTATMTKAVEREIDALADCLALKRV